MSPLLAAWYVTWSVSPWTVVLGAIVGLALGLTGGGGGILAIPLLVYALGVDPRQAVGISLAAVGATALIGLVQRLLRRQVEIRTGVLFALTGIVFAPLGARLADLVPEAVLLAGFAVLMGLVAVRMWREADRARALSDPTVPGDDRGPACQRDPEGRLRLTSRCALLLAVAGALTGVLSGLFGISGGFVIVPALVMLSQMDLRRAVGTSLLVIVLVSPSALAGHLLAGREISLPVAVPFAVGGALGMTLGTWLSRYLAGPTLQRTFAVLIVGVALFVLVETFLLAS